MKEGLAPSFMGESVERGPVPSHQPCRAVDPVDMAVTTGESGERLSPPAASLLVSVVADGPFVDLGIELPRAIGANAGIAEIGGEADACLGGDPPEDRAKTGQMLVTDGHPYRDRAIAPHGRSGVMVSTEVRVKIDGIQQMPRIETPAAGFEIADAVAEDQFERLAHRRVGLDLQPPLDICTLATGVDQEVERSKQPVMEDLCKPAAAAGTVRENRRLEAFKLPAEIEEIEIRHLFLLSF